MRVSHVFTLAALLALISLGEASGSVLVNPGFEELGRPAGVIGWKVHSGLDPNGYGGPDFADTFDEIVPTQSRGGRSGSDYCAGFPADGLWGGSIRDHLKPNGSEEVNGRDFGKAAISQTVTLDPGTYVFGAYLRTADGDAYTSAFSLGHNLGGEADYANDGSTGIHWTKHDLGLKTSFDNTGFLTDRGEFYEYHTEPFTITERGPVTIWIRFNYFNNNSMRTRWQVDDAFIRPYVPEAPKATVEVSPTLGAPLKWPVDGLMVADCGDDDERYLANDNSSTILDKIDHRLFQHARAVTGAGSFTYEFPVSRDQDVVYVAFEHVGPVKVTFGGRVVRSDTDPPDKIVCAKEYVLTDRSLWRNGSLKIKFESADPTKEAAVVRMDCGSTTRFRERLKQIEWDTVGVPWRIGLWDAYDQEFRGTERVCVIGKTDISRLGSDDMRIEWSQKIEPGHRYYLALGYYREKQDGGRACIDIGDDDLVEFIGDNLGEEVLDFDITDYLVPGKNVVSVQADAIDFVALIDTVPGITDNRRLNIYFGGDENAENLTRVINNSMFWVLDLHYDDSGFVDASIPRGNWWQQYWPIDIAFAMRAMLGWGYLEQCENVAKLTAEYAWRGHSSNSSGGSDNNGGNMLAMDMCEILLRRDFDSQLTERLWPAVRDYCAQICDEASKSRFGLIKGTNWENAGNREQGPCYALSTNLAAVFVLRKACDTGEAGDLGGDYAKWRETADAMRQAILDKLVFREDVKSPTGWVYPKGTWAYGLLDDGSYMLKPLAGYLWSGYTGSTYHGLIFPDPELQELYEVTLDAAMTLLNAAPFTVSGYARSYDGNETMFNVAALSDRLDHMARIVPEFLNQTDFARDVGSRKGELSKWAYGSPGEIEDTNLVCVAGFLHWPCFILGVDDLLHEGRQLSLIPRLPDGWNECGANDWRAQYLNAARRAETRLTFNYKLDADRAIMHLRTREPVKGLRVRFGPFDVDGVLRSAKCGDQTIRTVSEISGDRLWFWAEVDTTGEEQTVEVLAH